jgi:hypothetical protein
LKVTGAEHDALKDCPGLFQQCYQAEVAELHVSTA